MYLSCYETWEEEKVICVVVVAIFGVDKFIFNNEKKERSTKVQVTVLKVTVPRGSD